MSQVLDANAAHSTYLELCANIFCCLELNSTQTQIQNFRFLLSNSENVFLTPIQIRVHTQKKLFSFFAKHISLCFRSKPTWNVICCFLYFFRETVFVLSKIADWKQMCGVAMLVMCCSATVSCLYELLSHIPKLSVLSDSKFYGRNVQAVFAVCILNWFSMLLIIDVGY